MIINVIFLAKFIFLLGAGGLSSLRGGEVFWERVLEVR